MICSCCAAGDLDPLRLLEQMPPGMPLHEAFPILAYLLRERTHRRRHGALVRNLWRSSSIAVSAERVEVRSFAPGHLSPCIAKRHGRRPLTYRSSMEYLCLWQVIPVLTLVVNC